MGTTAFCPVCAARRALKRRRRYRKPNPKTPPREIKGQIGTPRMGTVSVGSATSSQFASAWWDNQGHPETAYQVDWALLGKGERRV
jgi:hypothetical protein